MTKWQPIKTAPRDGSHFLAWTECECEEFDEDDCKVRNVTERNAVVAYFVFGNFVEYPWRGTFPQNLKFTHWMPLPEGPQC